MTARREGSPRRRGAIVRRTPERYNAAMNRRASAKSPPSRRPAAGPAAPPLIPELLSPARRREVLGAALLVLGVLTLVALVSQRGSFSQAWAGWLQRLVGDGRLLLPFLLGGLGAWLLIDSMDDAVELPLRRPGGALLAYLCLLAFWQLAVQGAAIPIGQGAVAPAYRGGWLGFQLARAMGRALGPGAAGAVQLLGAAYGAGLAAGLTLPQMLDRAGRFLFQGFGELWARRGPLGQALRGGGSLGRPRGDRPEPPVAPTEPASTPAVQMALPAADEAAAAAPGSATEPGEGGDPARAAAPAKAADLAATQWQLPDMGQLLDPPQDQVRSPDEAERLARIIEQTLAEFGIPVEVVQINAGPTITQFGLRPGYTEKAGIRSKVPVRRILALQNDLALALAASPVRILAPVPGRPYVGVEVPNAAKAVVSLRGVMQSEAFQRLLERGGLPIALGRDTGGNDVAVDLTRMPHLLIAGATGSGKSVCVNTLIASLLLSHTPETMKMVLVDPKRVEMTQYRGLPHLATPVVMDAERVVGVLQWAVREMDRRYRAFAEQGARHLAAYNRLMEERGQAKLPFLVIVIDELADLMMLAPEETERLITRLAQLARATGIHLVLATQRPSVDVVTGLIKANFPSRIAFAVSSSVDSRVILDQQGAEKLLGQGDMLYQSSDDSKLRRLQGCFVSDEEIERLVHYWKFRAHRSGASAPARPGAEALGIPEPLIEADLWERMTEPGQGALAEEKDPLWDEAVALIRAHSAASTSFLQRKLKIGYSRAARLIDSLEAAGLVGPATGNAPREVTITSDADLEAGQDYRERLDAVFAVEPEPEAPSSPHPDTLPRHIDPRLLAPVPLPWTPDAAEDPFAGDDPDEASSHPPREGDPGYWLDDEDADWDLLEEDEDLAKDAGGGDAGGGDSDAGEPDEAGLDRIRPWLRG